MKNLQLSWILREIADLLELKGDNPFKIGAYRNAAHQVEHLPIDIGELGAEGRLREIRGIGPALEKKIDEWLSTGQMTYYNKLREEVPPGLLDLLTIPGLGPRLVVTLHRELGIESIDDLETAARGRKVRQVKGIGGKTEMAILRGIEMWRRRGGQALAYMARPITIELARRLATLVGVVRAELVGGLRRRQETVASGDILVVAEDPAPVVAAFCELPIIEEVKDRQDNSAEVTLTSGLEMNLYCASPEEYPTARQQFTGSGDHNRRLEELAKKAGLALKPAGLFSSEGRMAVADEADVYRICGLPFIEPELREDRGEVEAALDGRLPCLIKEEDIQGDLHVHSHWSDGTTSIRAMAEALRERGRKYMAICDHSRSLAIARGLSLERLGKQREEVRQLNEDLEGFRILTGVEVDILADGRLDYPDEVLAEMDVVVASIHTGFNQTGEKITERILAAIQNPHVDIIAHPTGRLLGRREPLEVDVERIIEEAARTGTILEINAYPDRLDLNEIHARWAKEAGVLLAINTDAHAPDQLDYLEYGVGVARRAWLEPHDVINCRPWEELEEILASVQSTRR
ncbi:MAG: DNA polymerase/3'-5' exonuclease PolX [Limnochordia bacterium]|jgi:DNA polymerase (family 10)